MSKGKIALIGFGVSNKAVYNCLKDCGYDFTVRTLKECSVPDGVETVFGVGYLNTDEDLIFRSPSCMPYLIGGKGNITTEAAFALSRMECRKILVTGSDGKTTVSTLINEILLKDGKSAYLGGNVGYPLINYMGRLKRDSFLVCELSSFQLVDLAPESDTAVITNITENHLDIHSSYEEYKTAKSNILKKARRAVINGDCSELVKMAQREFCGKEIIYASLHGMSKRADGEDCVYAEDGYILRNGEKILSLADIKLKGNFNILNVCLAVGAIYPYVSAESIRNAVSGFLGVRSRMELVCVKDGVSYYDSSIDSTPSRTLATLSAFNKDNTVVILGGYDKSLSYDALSEGLKGIKYAVICGSNSEKIYNAIKNSCNAVLEDSFTESVKIAYKIAERGDSVLLSPASASYDMFTSYKEKSEKYREIIRGL